MPWHLQQLPDAQATKVKVATPRPISKAQDTGMNTNTGTNGTLLARLTNGSIRLLATR